MQQQSSPKVNWLNLQAGTTPPLGCCRKDGIKNKMFLGTVEHNIEPEGHQKGDSSKCSAPGLTESIPTAIIPKTKYKTGCQRIEINAHVIDAILPLWHSLSLLLQSLLPGS